MGTDVFKQLMQAGVEYERYKGFLINETTNVSAVEDTLSSALGEPVKVIVPQGELVKDVKLPEPICFICSEPVGCRNCSYTDFCTKNAKNCLCQEHLNFILYRLQFMDRLKQVTGLVTEKAEVDVKEGVQWSEKYRPSDLSFMIGNEDGRLKFLYWLNSWKKGNSALLLGPPGVGKTTLVQLAAKKMALPLMQLNASDERSKTRLRSILSEGIHSRGLLGKGLLVFLDEVDGIDGRADYGSVDFIREAISSSRNPIVMAANDEDNDVVIKLQSKKIEVFRFLRVMPRLVELYLQAVLEREGIKMELEAIRQIIIHANGDVRAALNNVQSSLDLQYEIADRDEQTSVREAFTRIFTAKNFDKLYQAIELVEISSPSDLLRVVFNNIVANCKDPNKLTEALRQLSWLDTLVWEMEFGQRWELMRYLRRILAGILMATKDEGWRYVSYDPAFFMNRFSIWNDGRVLRAVAARIASGIHASRAQSILLYPAIVLMAKKGSKAARRLICLDDSSEKVCNKEYEGLTKYMEQYGVEVVEP